MLVVAIAIFVGGCAAPGAARLAGPPEGMPPSLAYIPGDSLGWIVADTDERRAASVQLRRTLGAGSDVADRILGSVVADDDGAAIERPRWVGPTVGVAMYTLRSGDASRLTFVDVDDRSAAEDTLRDAGWKEREGDGVDAGGDDALALWTREGRDDDAPVALALALADDALIAAATKPQLLELAGHARRYDASERPATAEYTIDALRASPVAIVYRSDALRADLRTLVRDDAALVELTRWAFQTSSMYALRDGWIGMVPAGGSRRATNVRVVGRMDWVRAATEVPEPRPVPRAALERVAGDARLAVAFDDPGAYLGDLLDAITDGGMEFTTDQDAPTGTPELQPLLDRLDGGASVVLRDASVEIAVTTSEPRTLAADLTSAFERVRIAGAATTAVEGDDTVVVTIALDARARALVDAAVRRGASVPAAAGERLGDDERIDAAFTAAGRPPTPPVGWLYAAASPCDPSRPVAGWVTWDTKTQRLAWSVDVPVAARTNGGAVRCELLAGSAPQ